MNEELIEKFTQWRVEDGLVGARAALETLDELLGEFVASRIGLAAVDETEPCLSIADVRRLSRAAAESIEVKL